MKEESRKILDELIREHSCRYARPRALSDEEYESIWFSLINREGFVCHHFRKTWKYASCLWEDGKQESEREQDINRDIWNRGA